MNPWESQSPLDRPEPCPRQKPYLHRLVEEELPVGMLRTLRQHVEECRRCFTYQQWLELEQDVLHGPRRKRDGVARSLWRDLLQTKIEAQVVEEAETLLVRWLEQDEPLPASDKKLRKALRHLVAWCSDEETEDWIDATEAGVVCRGLANLAGESAKVRWDEVADALAKGERSRARVLWQEFPSGPDSE